MNIFSMALLFLFTTYLGWFNFLDTLAFDTYERNNRTFAVESCLHPLRHKLLLLHIFRHRIDLKEVQKKER
ncbi:hypothetical protein AKG34_02520 [Peribacillus butanolivorans]|nr:hypothetical protein AKG34_02520 [Peribacillus butanolivorans]